MERLTEILFCVLFMLLLTGVHQELGKVMQFLCGSHFIFITRFYTVCVSGELFV